MLGGSCVVKFKGLRANVLAIKSQRVIDPLAQWDYVFNIVMQIPEIVRTFHATLGKSMKDVNPLAFDVKVIEKDFHTYQDLVVKFSNMGYAFADYCAQGVSYIVPQPPALRTQSFVTASIGDYDGVSLLDWTSLWTKNCGSFEPERVM